MAVKLEGRQARSVRFFFEWIRAFLPSRIADVVVY